MPAGTGFLQIIRKNVYATFVTFVGATTNAFCNDTVTFNLSVQSILNTAPTPSGSIFIQDINTGNIVGSGNLDGYGLCNISAVLGSGTYDLVATYVDVLNNFETSQSDRLIYSIGNILPVINLNVLSVGGLSKTYSFDITIPANGSHVVDGYAILYDLTPDGYTVIINNNVLITNQSGQGVGTRVIAAFTSGRHKFYAHYNGNGCYTYADSSIVNITV